MQASDNEWVLLTADHVYESDYNLFLYVKGPAVENGVGGDYYIDDFSLVPYGSPAVDFQNDNNILDIGAYEYMGSTMSIDDNILGNIENIISFSASSFAIAHTFRGDVNKFNDTQIKNFINTNAC